ncbi:YfkD family protein [Bacillus xiapuensis]|uniref:YfkD family protein n=1 Tax=Bacillus xiapuensis TaxID=2014075 RepID=UPI000C250523|nr:YfkD family protein [Bacillus xiapuensis]
MKIIRLLLAAAAVFAFTGLGEFAAAAKKEDKPSLPIPPSVKDLSQDNTYLNEEQELSDLQPSELTKELLSTSKAKITNPRLIRMLNETSVNKSLFSIGMRATVFLGEWPLSYSSDETSANWEYQKVNTNFFDNRAGKSIYQMHYVQEAHKTVRGGLSVKLPRSEEVKQMVLKEAIQRTNLPLAYATSIGNGTKQNDIYNVAPKTAGYLSAFAPAIHEKGRVAYGEVFLVLTGSKRALVIKNMTTKKVSAWIPISNHLSFSFRSVRQP